MKGARIPTWIWLILVLAIIAVFGQGLIPWEQFPGLKQAASRVSAYLERPFLHIGVLPVSPAFVLKATFFLFLLSLIYKASRALMRSIVLDRFDMDVGQKYALEKTVGYAIVLIGLIIGLDSTGLDLTSLTLVGGAVGIGVGFGMQSIASNFVSGLVLLLERPVKVGDRVEVGHLNGDVIRIGGRSTWVRTNDNIIVVLPNSEFIIKPVINWTATDRQVRFSLPFGVAYSSDLEEVRSVVLQTAIDHPDVLDEPAPDVILIRFGDNAVNFDLRFWTISRVQTPIDLKSELYFAIFAAFREHGIEIPFPQRDLHLRSNVEALQ